jgi:hypothetical protein
VAVFEDEKKQRKDWSHLRKCVKIEKIIDLKGKKEYGNKTGNVRIT